MSAPAITRQRHTADALAHLAVAVDNAVEALGDGQAGDPNLVEQLRTVHRAAARLQAAEAVLVARVEASGTWRSDGITSLVRFLTLVLGVLPSTAKRMAAMARALTRQLPAFEAPALAGAVTADHVTMTVKAALASQTRIDALGRHVEVTVPHDSQWSAFNGTDPHAALGANDNHDASTGGVGGEVGWWSGFGISPAQEASARQPGDSVAITMSGEEQLALAARQLRAPDYRIVLSRWAARVDPFALEQQYRSAEDREYFVLAKTLGGWHAEGFLTDRTGQLVKTALDAVHEPPTKGDPRSAGQRRAGDLASVADRFLSQGLAGEPARARPHVAVKVDYDTLRRLVRARTGSGVDLDALVGAEPAQWADGSGPLPYSLLSQLICDGDVARYVFGPNSELLNYGLSIRLFSREQRRALRATQDECAFPACPKDAAWGEAHHATPFAQDGPTDIPNGALLCGHHHRMFHLLNLTMKRDKSGRWRFYRPDGAEITTPG